MRHVLFSIARGVSKLFCILMAPVISVFNVVYKLAIRILSYGLIGLSLLCLLAIAAELFNYGITKEGIAYFVLATISLLVRWLLIYSVGIVEITANTISSIADPTLSEYNDYEYNTSDI